jgi:hypothetical protein
MPQTKSTARQTALQILQENPSGLSKNKLYLEIVERQGSCNTGAYRRLIQSMTDREEITVTEEDVPNWGLTKIVRATPAS